MCVPLVGEPSSVDGRSVANAQPFDTAVPQGEEVADDGDLALHAELDLHGNPFAVDGERSWFGPQVFDLERDIAVETRDRGGAGERARERDEIGVGGEQRAERVSVPGADR